MTVIQMGGAHYPISCDRCRARTGDPYACVGWVSEDGQYEVEGWTFDDDRDYCPVCAKIRAEAEEARPPAVGDTFDVVRGNDRLVGTVTVTGFEDDGSPVLDVRFGGSLEEPPAS
jgi:hypothetical protein